MCWGECRRVKIRTKCIKVNVAKFGLELDAPWVWVVDFPFKVNASSSWIQITTRVLHRPSNRIGTNLQIGIYPRRSNNNLIFEKGLKGRHVPINREWS
jgi:hypothetical protein